MILFNSFLARARGFIGLHAEILSIFLFILVLLLMGYFIHLLQHELALCKELILSIKEQNSSLLARCEALQPVVEAHLVAVKPVTEGAPLAEGPLRDLLLKTNVSCILMLIVALVLRAPPGG